LTFLSRGKFADCRRNDINAAKGSVNATAVQRMSAAIIAIVLGGS